MDVQKVVAKLKRRYPQKKIIKNDKNNPTEILCEIGPATNHPEYSLAAAVIDESLPHLHKKSKEKYKVTNGKLVLYVNERKHELKEGGELVVTPGQVHYARGNETWIECYSEPGWTFKDHILVKKKRRGKNGRMRPKS